MKSTKEEGSLPKRGTNGTAAIEDEGPEAKSTEAQQTCKGQLTYNTTNNTFYLEVPGGSGGW